MDRKSLIAAITKYHDYKRFVQTSSIEEAKQQLMKQPKYGTKRAVLETEINFYGFMDKVESIASKLTENNAETLKRILSLNTSQKLSAAEIANKIGMSHYKFQQSLEKILIELKKIEEM